MEKTAIAAVVVLAVLGLSAYTYTTGTLGLFPGSVGSSGLLGSGTGALSIYLVDSPHSNITLRYILLNVSSVTLRYGILGSDCSGTTTTTTATSTSTSTNSTSSNSTEGADHVFVFNVPSNVGTNVNITSLHGQGLLLGATNVPVGEVVQITLNVSGAEAFWSTGPPTDLKVVAHGKLMIPVHFDVRPDGSTTLTIDLVPGDIHVSQGNLKVLTPVIHVAIDQTGGCTTTTQTSTVSTSSSSTATSSTTVNSSATSTSSSTSTTVTNSTSTITTSSTNSTSTTVTTTAITNSTSATSTNSTSST